MSPRRSTAATEPNAPTSDRVHVVGEVVRGDQRGRLLGFPTANLVLTMDGPPADGVYAGFVHRRHADGTAGVHQAAVSVGRRPTFYAERGARLLEAHLLDVSDDLYGEELAIELVAKLRDQGTFAGPAALAEQLAVDVARCRDVLTVFRPARPD